MRFFKQLFGFDDSKTPAASRMFSQYPSDMPAAAKTSTAEQGAARRELLRAVLRKTLNRHGIPSTWLSAETLIATSRGRETGIHWRLLIKHWDPRLLNHSVALQNALTARVLSEDPLASEWLMGVSWQFSLAADAECPALPHAGYWIAEARPAPAQPVPAAAVGGTADVIAGPVRITTPPIPTATPEEADGSDSVKSDLDKLLAIRDAELQRNSQLYGSPEATQPMYLRTEPQPLPAEPERRR